MSGKKKFMLDISLVYFSQVIGLGIGLITNIFIGRWLGVVGLGLYSITLTFFMVIGMIAGIGIPEAIVKFISEVKDSKETIYSIFSTGIIMSLFSGTLAGISVYFLADSFSIFFGINELSGLLKIIAFAIPFLVINTTILSSLRGLREMKSYSYRQILRSVLLIGSITLFIFLGLEVRGAVLALLITEMGIFILLIFISEKFFKFLLKDFNLHAKKLFIFGSLVFLASALWTINTYMDTLLVGFFMTEEDVGYYAIAVAIAKAGFLSLPMAVSTVTFPMISEYHGKKLKETITYLVNKTMKFTLFYLSVLGLAVIFFSRDIILLLLHEEFMPAIMPLNILIYGLIFFGPVAAIGTIFTAMDRPDFTSKSNLLIAMINISLDIVLIPLLGITGAAIATVVSFWVLTIIIILGQIKVFLIPVETSYFIRTFFLCSAFIAVFFLLKPHLYAPLFSIILLLSYTGIHYMTIFTSDDREDLWYLINGLKTKFVT